MYDAPQTFGGVPTQRLWVDISTIEGFLMREWPSTVIEFGTGTGAFSVYLAAYCCFNGFSFHTFDTHALAEHPFTDRKDRCIGAIGALGGVYHSDDIFSPEAQILIGDLIRNNEGVVFLYCDDGDKPREIKTFAPYLRKGDFLGLHDYGTEVQDDDLPYMGFVPWRKDLFSGSGSSNLVLECVR